MSKYAEMAKGKLSSGREKASEYKGKAKGKVVRRIAASASHHHISYMRIRYQNHANKSALV
jgi:hypothetical protein